MNTDPDDQSSGTAPFPGPRPFTPAESAFFKGRDKESRDVRDLLLSYQVVVLYSKSGAGKSSLVNAGLRPLMIKEGFEVLPIVRVGSKVRPDIDLSKIANIFAFNVLSSCVDTTVEPAEMAGATLIEYLARRSEKRRLLVFDQLEELFSAFPERWRDREPFFRQVNELCRSDKDLRLLLVIREDQMAELDPYADLLPNSLRIRYRLERLHEAEALQAIVLPMALAGYTFQEGVDRELVSNLTKIHIQTDEGEKEVAGEFVEPVHLQVVCRNLWSQLPKERRPITTADVQKFADVDGTLAAFYTQAVRLAAAKARIAERIIRIWVSKKLITPGRTRALVYMAKTSTEGLPNEAVRVLEAERVIRAESRAGATWYELTHDRFIGPIRVSNRTWLAKRRRRKQVATSVGVLALISILAFIYFLGQPPKVSKMQDGADRRAQESKGLPGYKTAFEIDNNLKNYEAAARDLMGIGNAHWNLGENQLAIECYEKALSTFKTVDSQEGLAGQASALQNLGNIYRWLNDYDRSEECLKQSLGLYLKLKKPQAINVARVKGDLATVYGDRGKYDDALALQKEVRRTLFDLEDNVMAAWAALNMGSTLFDMGKQTEAFNWFKISRDEFRVFNDKSGEAWALAKLAQWYTGGHSCREGVEYANQALKLAQDINNSTVMQMAGRYKARAYLCANQLQQAEVEARQALEGAIGAKDKWDQAYNLETLALIAEAQGDIQRAIEDGEKSVALWDSISSNTVHAQSARANLARWKERLLNKN